MPAPSLRRRTAPPGIRGANSPSRVKPRKGRGTRESLLKAAGKLFSVHGYRSVSIRQIASVAGVNSALVGYHFRGKEQLFAEVFLMLSERINAARRRALAKITADGAEPDLPALLDAYIRPVLVFPGGTRGMSVFQHLSSVMAAERMDLYEEIATRAFSEINALFVSHVRKLLPDVPRETLIWRLYAIVGALLFVATRPFPPALRANMEGDARTLPGAVLLDRLLPFFVAGMAAPSAGRRRKGSAG